MGKNLAMMKEAPTREVHFGEAVLPLAAGRNSQLRIGHNELDARSKCGRPANDEAALGRARLLAGWGAGSIRRIGQRTLADVLLQTVTEGLEAIAAFCIIWPSGFAFSADSLQGPPVGSEDLFSLPRAELFASFGIGEHSTSPVSAAWHVERLPAALHRIPFVVPAATKLSVPISLGGELVGMIGIAFADLLDDGERVLCSESRGWLGRTEEAEVSRKTHSEESLGGASLPERADVTDKPLSARELEIGRYLAEGYSTINVGAMLGVSPNTVRTYVRRIYKKLGVCSRVELVHRMR